MGSAERVEGKRASGRYVYKNWDYGSDGARLGASPATFGVNPADLISSSYRNPDGSLTNFAISIDLDADRALPDWKRADGSLDWDKMSPRLKETLPSVEKYLAYVTRSSGGLGLSLLIGIKPLPLKESTFANQNLYCLTQVNLIHALSRLGFGADFAAVGLVRDFPNFKDSSRNLLSRPEVFRELESSHDKKHLSTILSACIDFLRSEERRERLYSDSRVEGELALLFKSLLEGSQEFTLKELMALTNLSRQFLQKILKKGLPWLLVTRRGYGHSKSWELSLNFACPDFDLKRCRMEALLKGDAFKASLVYGDAFVLCLPEDVEDGGRNAWLHKLALFYKWYGMSSAECLRKILLRMRLIPGIEDSRNGKAIESIVRSIYRNHSSHFGKYSGQSLPEWMLNDTRYQSQLRCVPSECVELDLLESCVAEAVCESVSSDRLVEAVLGESSAESILQLVPFEELPLAPSPSPALESDSAEEVSLGLPLHTEPSRGGFLRLVEAEPDVPLERSVEDSSTPMPTVEIAPSSDAEPVSLGDAVPHTPCFYLDKSEKVVSLQKGCNPIRNISPTFVTRLVSFDSHFSFEGVRYSVGQEYVGLSLQVYLDSSLSKILAFLAGQLIESHDFSPKSRGRVTKPHHCFFPQKTMVRADGHVFFHGKLYSTGSGYLGKKVYVSHRDDLVTITNSFGDIIAVHDSIQDHLDRSSTLIGHFEPWEKALEYDSYYRQTARSFGASVEEFVLGILRSKPGVIDASRIHHLFSLAKKHDRDLFLSLCWDQVAERNYRLKPLRAMLDWLDG